MAEAYLREGARVMVDGRSREKGKRALAGMGAGDHAHFIAGDVGRSTMSRPWSTARSSAPADSTS